MKPKPDIQCIYCKMKLSSKESKSRHQKYCKHRADLSTSSESNNHVCNKCGKTFLEKMLCKPTPKYARALNRPSLVQTV